MTVARHMALDAERAVLGSVLIQNHALEPLLAEAGLRAEHFYYPSHQALFAAMAELFDVGEGIDSLTLRGRTEVDAATIEALAAAPPVVGNAVTYGRQVIDAARWRARYEACLRQREAIEAHDEDAYSAALVTDEPERGDVLTGPDLTARFEAWITGPDRVVPLPWPQLNDALFGGARPGDTTVIAGWSTFGKSVAAVQWLEHISTLDGNVALYTNEMAVEDVTARLLAGMTAVPFERILSRRLTDRHLQQLRDAYPNLKVQIIAAYGWSAQDIARHIRRRRWDLCCLDLFNRLPGRETVADVDAAISGLCNAAAQAGSHLIVVSQLNQYRSRDAVRPMPTMRDLRESGAMANDPANVIFVHREQEEIDGIVKRLNDGHIYIDKARNGQAGGAEKVSLNPYRMRFELPGEGHSRHLEAVQ